MKYLGKEETIEVKTKSVRKIEYVRCDRCGKKILPKSFRSKENGYVHIHTWHNDWGNDSIESHERHDYCKECAKSFIAEYINDMDGTEELELEFEHLWTSETHDNYRYYDDGYSLTENDKYEQYTHS